MEKMRETGYFKNLRRAVIRAGIEDREAVEIITGWFADEDMFPEDVTMENILEMLSWAEGDEEASEEVDIVKRALEVE